MMNPLCEHVAIIGAQQVLIFCMNELLNVCCSKMINYPVVRHLFGLVLHR